jgi:thymidylate synthase (FAD)
VQVVEASVQIMDSIDENDILTKLEWCGRTAYKSESKITKGSAEKFIRSIIRSGHGSVLEHVNITVKFICDRGITHELVRHRIASYTQESTRYCNYTKKGMTFIRPSFWAEDSAEYKLWRHVAIEAEETYNTLIKNGATPQEARSVLPDSLKTEIVATMNIREWRHVLDIRTKPDCHPQMRQIMSALLKEFKLKLPVIFEDITD